MELLEWIHNIDAQILLFIQQYLRSDLFTWLWKGITFLGDGGWFWIVWVLLFLFPKKTRKAGVTALLALANRGSGYELCLKDLVARIRPYGFCGGTCASGCQAEGLFFSIRSYLRIFCLCRRIL